MRVLVLVNGGRMAIPQGRLDLIRKEFEAQNLEPEIVVTRSVEQAEQLAREATQEKYSALYAAGGDGTIHLAINQLHENSPPLGILPMGTVNALARTLGISRNLGKAIRQLAHGKEMACDCGVLGTGKAFVCFASAGYDAGVVHAVKGLTKRYLGRIAYGWHGFTSWCFLEKLPPLAFSFPDAEEIGPDGAREPLPRDVQITGHTIVLSNIANYAGFKLFPNARLDDGSLEAWLFTDCSRMNILRWIAGCALQGKPHCMAGVRHLLIRKVEIRSAHPYYLQLDGDAVPLLQESTSIECKPGFIRLLLPG